MFWLLFLLLHMEKNIWMTNYLLLRRAEETAEKAVVKKECIEQSLIYGKILE